MGQHRCRHGIFTGQGGEPLKCRLEFRHVAFECAASFSVLGTTAGSGAEVPGAIAVPDGVVERLPP